MKNTPTFSQSKDKILLIDGDNLCHRAYHKFSNFTNRKGESSALPFGFFYILGGLIKKFKADQVFVAFDGGSSEHRRKILPGYRIREKSETFDSEVFNRQKHEIRELCETSNINTLWEPHMEADDLIYMVTKRVLSDSYVTIVSSDKDFIQLIGGNITVFNPFKNTLISELNVEKETGYSPKQHLQYLILNGDKSDKVPGVKGMGEVRIKAFLQEFDTIQDYIDDSNQTSWCKYPIEEVYLINNPLINLKLHYLLHLRKIPLPIIYHQNFSRDNLLSFFNQYDISKLDPDIYKDLT